MKILIHGRNLELTEALKEYTSFKIKKAAKHYKDFVQEADIHLSVEKNPRIAYQCAEVTIFANGTVIRAQEKSDNLYSSIDLVSNKLSRQLRKYKEKNTSSIHQSNTNKKDINSLEKENSDINIDNFLKKGIKSSLPEPSIKKKYFEMLPMTLKEAREQLDLIDHNFYVFRDKKNSQIQVIYKRHNGGYGLIQSK